MGEQLPQEIKTVWWQHELISGAFWLALAIGALVGHALYNWPIWIAIAIGVVGVSYALVKAALIPYRFRYTRYLITPTAVYLRSGLFFRQEEAIPITRIQNVTLSAGPLLHAKGLQSVTVETASTTHEIAGVLVSVAEQLRDRIIELALEARDDA